MQYVPAMENGGRCREQPWIRHVAWLAIGVMVTSCRFDLPQLPGGDAGGASDGATSGAGSLPLELVFLAGDLGSRGNADDTGAAARFNLPSGVAVDGAGNVYVADRSNNTIRKVSAAGVVTTLAGTAGTIGTTDGVSAAARFNSPSGVAVDSAGNVYVADRSNNTIRKVTATGVVTTLAGTALQSGSTDGTGAGARFNRPYGVAVDSAGNLYVADNDNHTIRKITVAGVVTTLAGTAGMSGSTDGTGPAARFNFPHEVAVDSAGNVYVADQENHAIRKITTAGVVTTLAGTAGTSGSTDGTGAAARFYKPSGVAVDGAGNLYVADQFNYTIRKVTATGVVTTLAGTASAAGGADGTGAAARFAQPFGVAIDSTGNVYVADQYTIRKITAVGVVMTLAGAANKSGSADGTGAAARFYQPFGVAVDSAGNVYVADKNNRTIRKVTAAGVVTTLAGAALASGSTDGTGTMARFNFPHEVAVDSAGNVYVADQLNHSIRKVTAAGVVTTLAGAAGTSGSTDGAGTAARFNRPSGVAVDGAGNIYVADQLNDTIRKITTAGVVTTLVGTAGMSGSADGMGAAARFSRPSGVAVDSTGNLYVTDQFNNTIRKVTADGIVTTLAGTASPFGGSTDGTGPVARFNFPTGVAVDSGGNVYIVDTGNSTIRKVTATGTTTTIAGLVGMQGIALGVPPRFAFPVSLAISGDSIVISDANAILLLRHGAQ